MRRSRLSKKSDKKNLTTIFLSLLGIVVVLFILVKFGLSFLVNFSLLLSNGKNQNQTIKNGIDFVPSPVLNPIPNATNSAKITVTGKSIKGLIIDLYINNSNKDQVAVDDKGNFSFTQSLTEGSNQIKTIAENKSKKSDFSNIENILYKNTNPSLSVVFPTDGQSFKKDQNAVNVTGTTDAGTNVTVNGFWAVIDENNNFSYNLPLQNGDNQIKVVATDQAGNKTEKDLKVNYSQ